MIRNLTALVLAFVLVTGPAGASCVDEIRGVLKSHDAGLKNVTATIETSQKGEVLLRTNVSYLDYENIMFETVGRSYWTLIRGLVQFTSDDGKTWRKDMTQPEPDWVEASRKNAAKMRAGLQEAECVGEQQADGKTFKVYRYFYEAKLPYETESRSTLFVESKTGRIIRHDALSLHGSPETLIRKIYTYDQSVELPNPGVK
ncbi:MAG: hypothetical protein RIC14_07225 [Filomicrobium sp.]